MRSKSIFSLALGLVLPFASIGCSLQILGVNPDAASQLSSSNSSSSGSDPGGTGEGGVLNSFSVLGATGGSDTVADTLLTDGSIVTAEWVDTTGEDSYEVKILDSTGSSVICGPVSVPANTIRYTFSGCTLSHGASYRIQVTAKNSSTASVESTQGTFHVGPFISLGDVIVGEWGIASIPVTLSYAMASPVTVQYVTVDGSALSGSDYTHIPLSTLTIPAGNTSAMISVPVAHDLDSETDETFRVELSSPSGARLQSTSASAQIQNNDQPVPAGFLQVAAGSSICAVTSGGGAKCWGNNTYGQLGINGTTTQNSPVDVFGLSSGVAQVSQGYFHTCGLTSGGAVKCWGSNTYGQLGDNTTTSSLVPIDVEGLSSGITQVSAGYWHACALTSGGAVKCWGRNNYGQLGDNSTTDRPVPTDVFGLSSGITQVVAGETHTCVLTSAGEAKCWGRNSAGRLGDNTMTNRLVPTQVFGLTSGVVQIAAGPHTCALTSAGAVKCWGGNFFGQIGDNSTTSRSVPTDVLGLSSGVAQIAISGASSHSCALLSSGAMKCWGYNGTGQLGNRTSSSSLIPTNVLGLAPGVTQISAGAGHTCALVSAGALQCWGGVPLEKDYYPKPVMDLSSGVTQAYNGAWHTCALTSSGGAKCWGKNVYGQLGDNTTVSRDVPADVLGLTSGVTQLAVGYDHTCALTSAGAVKCVGRNGFGQLGDNTLISKSVPTDVPALTSGVIQIAAGENHSCALTSAGAVKCWGRNNYGQLGDNTTVDQLVPIDVSGLSSGVTQILAGTSHTCALTSAGAVKCWGYNSSGQLGDNTLISKSVPTDVSSLFSGVTQIAVGGSHTCALTSAGGIKCWGYNGSGQIGDNSGGNQLVPADVFGLASGVIQVTAGGSHTCALTDQGAALCWGSNSMGQLGDATDSTRTVPTPVSGLGSGVTRLTNPGVASTSCAITSGGALQCWGWNTSGELGLVASPWAPLYVRSP